MTNLSCLFHGVETSCLFTQAHLSLHRCLQMCELDEEQLSASNDDEEGHNIWNAFLGVITNCGFENRIQSSLADEKLGRVGLRCHYAPDSLCAKMYTL